MQCLVSNDVGDEAILSTLWGRYENAFDKHSPKNDLKHLPSGPFVITWVPTLQTQLQGIQFMSIEACQTHPMTCLSVECPAQVEKRKLFFIFLKQFLIIYKNWEPAYPDQFAEAALPSASTVDDIVVGCCTGHPSEISLTFIEEVTHVKILVEWLD
ncbi:hypothetical protein CsSME_00014140 [Camellia sinensis var. sinensis]